MPVSLFISASNQRSKLSSAASLVPVSFGLTKQNLLLSLSGTGQLNNAGGQLIASLAAAGVSPDNVDTVLLTHCHPDPIGGLLDPEKQPVFKRAEIMLHPLEAQHWQDDEKLSMANERGQRNFRLARQTLNAYAQKLRFFTGIK